MRVIQFTSAAAFIALIGACSTPVAHVAGDAAPATDRPSSAPTVAATTATPSATVPTVVASAEPVKTTSKKTNPCPVKASTLSRALQYSEFNENTAYTPRLDVQACYRGYAVAREQPNAGERAWVSFKYNAGTGRWKALALGTDGVCEGHVPADIASHLGEC